MRQSISIKLFNTLQKGKEQLSKEALGRIAGFVDSQRLEDDSFMNKSGKSDLYYTVFGWMLSYVLDIGLDAKKTALYLSTQQTDSLDLIHYAAFMRCRIIRQLINSGKMRVFLKSFFSVEIKKLEDFDGLPHNDLYSPYTQFIWLSLLEDTNNIAQSSRFKVQSFGFSNKDTVLQSLLRYHSEDGGFMNVSDGLTATTNATAAALGIIGQLQGYKDNMDIHYLRELQQSSGGFSAAKASPLPDLLSTATALFMLSCYGVEPKLSSKSFIDAHWQESGGFSATIIDDKSDVEYTFYGLLALGASSACSN